MRVVFRTIPRNARVVDLSGLQHVSFDLSFHMDDRLQLLKDAQVDDGKSR
jgi:hypothetical protein